jgi:hypothetical protein
MAWHDHLPRLHTHLGEEEQDSIVGCRNHKPICEMRQDSAYPSPRLTFLLLLLLLLLRYGRSVYRALTEDQHLGPYEHTPARQARLSVSLSLSPALPPPPSFSRPPSRPFSPCRALSKKGPSAHKRFHRNQPVSLLLTVTLFSI